MADTNGTKEEEPIQEIKETVEKVDKNGGGDNPETPADASLKSEADVKPELIPIKEMSPELRAKRIKRQIEYYFGDFNLPTDKFLRTIVKEKDGWVPIETMLKFKRLASLSQDPAVIVEALAGSELVQVSEDKTELRRNPDKPLPEENEARRKEIMTRTVYVKGFPTENFTIDNALDFFEEFGPTDDVVLRFWQDKAEKTWKFKGSTFVKFPTKEAAAAFLALEEVKFEDTPLIRSWQEEYIEKKRKERLELKMQNRKGGNQDSKKDEKDHKSEEDKSLPKNATLHMTNIPEGLTREKVKEKVETLGVMVAFIDFNKGDEEGWVRLHEEGTAAKVLEECKDGVLDLGGDLTVTLRALEGEEETTFLETAQQNILNRRQKGRGNPRGRGRGGRGGRGGGRDHWRKRRHDRDNRDEPEAKAAKTEGSDGE